ncbi:MAG: recombination mediator RecR [Proteobacteria bacterium]|nr:recombination mediator RecR [Pseudomonadota bacterium]
MSARPEPVERLVRALRRLPGVGEKTATRLAFFLLSAPETVAAELADAVGRLRREIRACEVCFDLTADSPCSICGDPERATGELCVVEEPADLASIESTGSYRGLYHVLGGAIAPLDGIGPEALHIEPLLERVKRDGVREVILATNPNPEGEATALFIAEQLRPHSVGVTRIGYGMPIGGDFEYVDTLTVRKSLENRRRFGA